jgi:histidinol-phosphate phosphatase family protein
LGDKGLRPAVFLDRDGVLNRDSEDFIRTPDEVAILPGVPESVKRLNDAGYVTLVITNQSGIRRGYFTEQGLHDIHARLIPEVESAGGRISQVYFCPHLPDDKCECRKPLPGMLKRAEKDHGIDFSRSFFVGDRPEDIACGFSVGARTILVLTGKSAAYDPARFPCPPDHVCRSLSEAADWIIGWRLG